MHIVLIPYGHAIITQEGVLPVGCLSAIIRLEFGFFWEPGGSFERFLPPPQVRLALQAFGEESVNLSCLIPLVKEVPAYRQLIDDLTEKAGQHRVAVLGAAQPYLVAALHQELPLPMLVMVSSAEDARRFYEQLLVWCNDQSRIILFPEPDALPYERLAPDSFVQQQRLQALASLAEARRKSAPDTQFPLVISSAAAVARKTIPCSEFVAASHTVRQGMQVDPLELLTRWNRMGYQRVNLVEVPGTMSQRGGILDVYPPDSELPARIDFFGSEVESIRLFDPHTQRSSKLVTWVEVVPAEEAAWAETDTFIDYLPPNSLVVLAEPSDVEASIGELDVQASQLRQSQVEKGELPQDSPVSYLTYPELEAKLDGIGQRLVLTRWSMEEGAPHHIAFTSAPSYGGQLRGFLEGTKRLLQERCRIIVISHQAARLSELLQEEDIFVSPLSCLEHPPSKGSLALVQGSLSEGWIMGGDVVLLTDAEIFGFVKQRRLMKPRPVRRGEFLPELSPGDYAVHVDHGIARFAGITRMQFDQVEREYLTLEYAAGDRLYLPADQADRVSRYIGGGEPPALSRLGTQEWARAKQRVRESAREMAQELLTLYAAREVIHGFAFSSDTPWQQELEASFPYLETPDQMEAVQQVKEDMEESKPMDRLVCGYGSIGLRRRGLWQD